MARIALEQWGATLPPALRATSKRVEGAIFVAPQVALREARRLVPVRSGRLRYTLRAISRRRGRQLEIVISAGSPNVRYAELQERGGTVIAAGRLLRVPIGVRQHPFRPRDVPNSFVLKAKNGRLYIVQRQPDRTLRLLWALRERVTVRRPQDRSPPWPGTVGPTLPYAAEGVRIASEGLAAKLARAADPERARRGAR